MIGSLIKVSGTSKCHKYFVKFNTARSELITLDQTDKDKTDLWYPSIIPGTFTSGDNTYSVIEKNTYRFVDQLYRVEQIFLEKVAIVGTNKIQTRYKNLIIKVDPTGIPINLTLSINGKTESNDIITDFDSENGIIFLKKNVSVLDKVELSYTYKLKTIPYKFLQLNPSKKFSSLNISDQMMKNYILFMLPLDILDQEKQRSIFHLEYYKYPSLYTGKTDIEISEASLISYLNETNPETGKSNIYDVIDTTYLTDTSRVKITPFILGTISTINTSTPSSVYGLDVRVRGGGLPESLDIETLEKELPNALYNIDICYLDGRPYPANNVYIVRLPVGYINEHTTRLEAFDRVLIRTLRTLSEDKKESYSYNYALENIKNVIKRFLPASAYIKFEIIQG